MEEVDTPDHGEVSNRRRSNLRLQRLNSELLDAVALGDVQEVLRLLAHGASVDATCAPTHCATIHVAALFGHLAVLRVLVERGATVNCSDSCDRSPLHLAAWAGSRECLVFLLERCPQLVGARVGVVKNACEVIDRQKQDASSSHDHQALHGKLPVLEPGSTALHVASQLAHVECVKCLLEAGADHTTTDEGGMTSLDVVGERLAPTQTAEGGGDGDDAVSHKRFPRTIQILISAGAKIRRSSFKRNSRRTLIRTAVELRSLDAIRLLVAAFGTLFWDKAGDTPLHVAVARRLSQPLKVILEACRTADQTVVDECNAEGLTALHAAVTDQWGTGVNILLEAGASLLVKTPTNATVLHLAAATGNSEILAELLNILEAEGKGAQILDTTNNAGETALYCAVGGGSIECVSLLVSANADISTTTVDELNVLHRAAELNHPEILDLLLRQGKGSLKDTDAILVAASRGFTGCVEVLVRHGCMALEAEPSEDHSSLRSVSIPRGSRPRRPSPKEEEPKARVRGEESALHLAAAGGHASVVEVLLRQNAALVRKKDAQGRTPIHNACRHGHRECVSLLLASRADLSVRCKDGDDDVTAMELLMRNIARPVTFLEKSFDAAITVNDRSLNDSEVVVTVDYGILDTGGKDRDQLRVVDALTKTGNRFGQQTLLLHPLIESFLYLKWRKMSPYFYALIAFYTVFVVTFSVLCLVSHYFHDIDTPVPSGLDETACRYIVVVLVVLLSLIELVHIFQMPLLYLRDAESWLKMSSFTLSLVVTFAPSDAGEWLRHVTTIAVLVTWMQYLYLISRVPRVGYYILMFARVTVNVLYVLVTFLFLIVGFAISFMIQFKANPPFNTPWEALLKTFVMMTGDFDYDGLFGGDDDLAASPLLGRIVFLVFVVLVGIALMNLLVGMAVNDIAGLEIKGNITRLRKQAEFLSLLEGMLVNALPARLGDAHKQISTVVRLYPNKPRKEAPNPLPPSLKEKILMRVMRARAQVVGEPTLQDIYAQISSLSNSVDVMSGDRIKVSDHVDSVGPIQDLIKQLETIKLMIRQVTEQRSSPRTQD